MSSKTREALLKASIALSWATHGHLTEDDAKECLDIVEAALADPVRKYEAKWKLGAEYEYAYCSHCGHQQWASWDSSRKAVENIGEFHKEYKFCPNCGFKMIGATDEQ